MSSKIVMLVLGVALLLPGTVARAITSARSLTQLISKSDAAVVLTVDSVTQVGDEFYLAANVVRVPGALGQAPSLGPAQVIAQQQGPLALDLISEPTVHRLCFLKYSQKGWVIVSRIESGVSFEELCFPALSQGELEAVDSSLQEGITNDVLTEAAAGLAVNGGTTPWDVAQIVSAVELHDVDPLAASLEALPYPTARGLAAALQLKNSDPAAPEKLLNPRWETVAEAFQAQVSSLLCTDYRSPSPAGISALGELTRLGKSIYVRRCAAMALRAVHVTAAVPYLVELLGSDDQELRLLGVRGLSDYVNSGRIPYEPQLLERGVSVERTPSGLATTTTLENGVFNRDKYLQDEQHYLSFWDSWWRTNRASIMRALAENAIE